MRFATFSRVFVAMRVTVLGICVAHRNNLALIIHFTIIHEEKCSYLKRGVSMGRGISYTVIY